MNKKESIQIVILFTLILVFIIIIFIIPQKFDVGGRDYLLSAISQGLAAIFGLVFTLTLIMAQLSSRFSYRTMELLFSKFTLSYMFFFILSIIFPLIVLKYPNDLLVNIALILMFLCLLFLIPYFLSFKNKLNPEILFNSLKKQAVRKFKEEDILPVEIKTIDNIIMSTFQYYDYDTFEKGIVEFVDLALLFNYNLLDIKNECFNRFNKGIYDLDIEKKHEKELYEKATIINKIIQNIYHRIQNISNVTRNDPRIPLIIINALKEKGEEAVKAKMEDSSNTIVEILAEMRKNHSIEFESLLALQHICILSTYYGLSNITWSMFCVFDCGMINAAAKVETNTTRFYPDIIGSVAAQAYINGYKDITHILICYLYILGAKYSIDLPDCLQYVVKEFERICTPIQSDYIKEKINDKNLSLSDIKEYRRQYREGSVGIKMVESTYKLAQDFINKDYTDLKEPLIKFYDEHIKGLTNRIKKRK